MRAVAVLALVVLAGSPLGAGTVEVKVTGTGLDVKATAAPLSDVLERISRQTGMKVVYEGTPTRAPVTASLERATAAEVVMSLLEGQGISYALIMDPTGTRVETLMMVSNTGGNTGGSGATAAARTDQRRNPTPPRVEPPAEEPQPEPEEEPQPQEAPPGVRPGTEPVSPPGTPANAVPTPFPTSPFGAPQGMVPFMQPLQPGLPLNGTQPPPGAPQPAPGQPEGAPGPTPAPPPPEPRP